MAKMSKMVGMPYPKSKAPRVGSIAKEEAAEGAIEKKAATKPIGKPMMGKSCSKR